MEEVKKAIYATLLYADIFKTGIEKDNLWLYLISQNKIKKSDFQRVLINGEFQHQNYFYALSSAKKIKASSRESVRKLAIASTVCRKLSFIPTVCFIGISGSTAFFHAEKKDDIDLFIIAENNSVWITRLLLVLLLEFLGIRRKKTDSKVMDKICLNMLIERKEMTFNKERQDVYTAHEIVRMIPIFQRANTYKKLLGKNKWVLSFLPNAFSVRNNISILRSKKTNSSLVKACKMFNSMAKFIQFLYMKKHKDTEVITDSFLAFHPFDYRVHILREYDKRKRKYGIE